MIAVWLLAAAATSPTYNIAGVVMNDMSHQPVGGARVTITSQEQPGQRLAFVTGSDGRFVFAAVPPGKYELLGQRRGLLSQGCDPRVRPAGAIVTGPGQHTDSLVLPLCPPGTISGRMVDDAGEPVEQARVELFRSAIVNGRRRVATIAVKQTADTGDFRFGALPAGTYYLAASGSPWYTKFAQSHGDNAARDMTHAGYQIQFHSNVSDPAAAEPLTLKAGQEATANFVLLPVPAAAVHVHIAGKEDLSKRFSLTGAGLQGSRVLVRQGTQSGDLYNFWGIPPGHYAVRVDASDASRAWYAEEEFDVGGTDLDVSATLREVPSLAGTLEVEGGQPAKLRIMLVDLDSGNRQPLPSDANGRFSLSSISAQRFRVALAGEDDYYLKRWSVEGAGREGEVLDLRKSSAVRLKVWAAKGAGRVKGTIHRDGQPLSGALIVLAPATVPAEQEEFRATPSASDGSYEFRGVRPGAYALFAVEDGADLEYADPAAVQPYLRSARPIRVGPGEVVNGDLLR